MQVTDKLITAAGFHIRITGPGAAVPSDAAVADLCPADIMDVYATFRAYSNIFGILGPSDSADA
jgi:hypothetical protein